MFHSPHLRHINPQNLFECEKNILLLLNGESITCIAIKNKMNDYHWRSPHEHPFHLRPNPSINHLIHRPLVKNNFKTNDNKNNVQIDLDKIESIHAKEITSSNSMNGPAPSGNISSATTWGFIISVLLLYSIPN